VKYTTVAQLRCVCDTSTRNAQLSDAFLVINQIEAYNASDTEAVSRLASAIERFTGVCVLVLEANIGSFSRLISTTRVSNNYFVFCRKSASSASSAPPHFALQHTPGVHEQAHAQRCVAPTHSIR
jgi:hypothetical protein